MSANARMIRLNEIVDACITHNCLLTEMEMQQILADAQHLYTPEAYRLVAMLICQIRMLTE